MIKLSTLPGVLCICLLSSGAFAQPAGWSYIQPFLVTENSNNTLVDYQLKLTIDTQTPIGNGQMSPSGDDIRFGNDCAGTILFNYWIESGLNTANTVIWVKTDTLFAGATSQIYMYYGNPLASPVSSIPNTFFGPHSSTDSLSYTNAGGVTNSQRGFRFYPNEDILVTAFGKFEPTGSTRYITLFDFNTQAILSQQQVSGPAAQYTYGNIASPLWLIQGVQYLLEMYQGATDGYYFGAGPQIGQHLTYIDMRYCNGCTQNTFPTNYLNAIQYGYPDMWYFTKKNVNPAPAVIPASLSVSAGLDQIICTGDTTMLAATVTNGEAPFSYLWAPAGGLSGTTTDTVYASPAQTTIYSILLTDADGCTAIDSVVLNLLSLPAVVANSSFTSICIGDSVTLTGSGADSYTWNNGVQDSVTFAPAATDVYILTGTDQNNCQNTDTITITVNLLPAVMANGGPVSICMGDSVTLSGSGADSYTWNNGVQDSVTFAPAATDNYIVTGTDQAGCQNTDTITVTVNPSPVITFGPFTSPVCVDEPNINLTATPQGGSFGGTGLTGNIFSPGQAGAGTYDIVYIYSDSNSCTNSDTISITVLGCLSLDGAQEISFQVYPNPSTGTIWLEGELTGAVAEIWDMQGKLLQSSQLAAEETYMLNLEKLAAGVYQLRIRKDGEAATRSLIIAGE